MEHVLSMQFGMLAGERNEKDTDFVFGVRFQILQRVVGNGAMNQWRGSVYLAIDLFEPKLHSVDVLHFVFGKLSPSDTHPRRIHLGDDEFRLDRNHGWHRAAGDFL